MRRKTPVFLAVLVLLAAAVTPAREPVHPLYLWNTSNGEARIHLVGSIHLLNEDFYPLPEQIMSAAAESDYLILEADISEISEQEISELVMQHGMYLDDTTLEDHIPPKLYDRVIEQVRESGLPEDRMVLMKPWLLGTTLATVSEAMTGYDPALGMEYFFVETFPDTEILELEGVKYQLGLFASLSEKDQILFLEMSLDDGVDTGETIAGILNSWKAGDDESLERLLAGSSGGAGSLNRRLVTERNRRMADRILEFTAGSEDTFLVMVGTAHYLGEGSVPARLAEAGLDIRRVLSDGSEVPVR